ncbi:hypothetical protein D3C85_1114600 [compost metagenome]
MGLRRRGASAPTRFGHEQVYALSHLGCSQLAIHDDFPRLIIFREGGKAVFDGGGNLVTQSWNQSRYHSEKYSDEPTPFNVHDGSRALYRQGQILNHPATAELDLGLANRFSTRLFEPPQR